MRRESYSGLADVNLGVTWRFLDEALSDYALMPSVALRAGGIIAGDYQTGYINSLGDGGDGFEVSALAGKFFADRFACLESSATGIATMPFPTISSSGCRPGCHSGTVSG